MTGLFSDKLVRSGVIGIVVGATLVFASLRYDRLPFLNGTITHSAEFEDAGGLISGDAVQVAGVRVGWVQDVRLDGDHVLISFTLPPRIRLGDNTRAGIKTTTVLGRKALAIAPAGPVTDSGAVIPVSRTISPYSLNDALGDLSATVRDLDTKQMNKALDTISTALTDTPEPLRATLDGVSRLSKAINARDESLRSLLVKAQGMTKVLSERGNQLNALVVDGNHLLAELDLRRTAISELITNVRAVAHQLTGLVRENQQQLKPTLDKLNSVLNVLQRNRDQIGKSLDGLIPFATALGEQVASGPFFQSYVTNLPDSVNLQMLVDALVWPEHLGADIRTWLKDGIKLYPQPQPGAPPQQPGPPPAPQAPAGIGGMLLPGLPQLPPIGVPK